MLLSARMIVEKYNGIENIARELKTDPRAGRNDDAATLQNRIEAFGANKFAPPHIKTLYELIMENFEDKINVILLVAGLVSIAVGLYQEGWPKGMIEGASIIISLLIIIGVNSGNNYMSERRLAELVNKSEEQLV